MRQFSSAGTGSAAVWIAVIVALLMVAPAGASTPIADGPGGRIAYSEEDDVWTVNADGTDRVRLTTEAGPEFDPVWSPDGTRIAYRDSRRGINQDDEIYVMAADGSGKTNLTNDPANDWSPAWSPDGEQIAFSSTRDGFPRLYVMNASGGGVTRLTEGWVEYPSWSPDGSRVVYQCHQGGGGSPSSRPNYDLCIVNADGTGETTLLAHPAYEGFPAWSPEGQWIAFQTERDSCPNGVVVESEEACEDGAVIFVMAADGDGSDAHRVTEPALGGNQFPVWSPDSSALAVSVAGQVVLVALDGRTVADLGPGSFPDWSASASQS